VLPAVDSPSDRRCVQTGSTTTPLPITSAGGEPRRPRKKRCRKGAAAKAHLRTVAPTANPKAASTCSVATCPLRLKFGKLKKFAREHKLAHDAELRSRDAALNNLAIEHRRQTDATDLRHLNTLNTIHELHGIHISEIERKCAVSAKQNELVTRKILASLENYKEQRNQLWEAEKRLRGERDAALAEIRNLRLALARDRSRALFPGSAPS
jgi:hypothetical protein